MRLCILFWKLRKRGWLCISNLGMISTPCAYMALGNRCSSSLWINHFTIYINHFTIYINHFTIYINHFTIHINHTILPLSTIYIEPSSSSLWINHFTSYINHFTSTIFPYIKSSFFKINRLHFYLSENSSIHSLQMFWVVALIEHADIN